MYKLVRRVIYLFYRYYSVGGKKRIPFQSSLFFVTFLIGIHILQIKLLIFGKGGIIPGENKLERLMWSFLFLLPIYMVLRYFFKEEDIKTMTHNSDVKRQYIFLWGYVIFTFILLTVLILWRSKII